MKSNQLEQDAEEKSELQQMIFQLEKDLDEKMIEVEETKSELEKNKTELQNTHQTFNAKETELEILLKQKEAEIEALDSKPKEVDDKILQLEELNADLKLELCETKDDLVKVNQQIEKLHPEISELKQLEENLRVELKAKDQNLLQIQTNIVELETEKVTLEDQIKDQGKEYECKIKALCEDIVLLEDKLKDLDGQSEEIQRLQSEIDVQKINEISQNKVITEIRFELAQAEDLKDDLEEKLKEAQDGQSEEIQRLKMQIDTLNSNNKEQNKLLSELRYELVQAEDLKDELEAKDQSLEQSKSQNSNLETEIKEQQINHENKCQTYSEEITKLKCENDQLGILTQEHKSIAEELKSNLETKIANLEKINVDLRVSLAETEDEKDELNDKLGKLEEMSAKFQSLDQDRQADQELIGLLEEKLKEAQDGQSEEIQRLKMQIDTLNSNIKEQNKLLSELRYELVQAEDLKDELEAKIKELQSSESNEYVKKIRDKMAAQTVELASMKVELKQSEGNQSNAVRKVHLELEAERGQVKRLKEEIRRMTISQRSGSAKDLDSTYVAPARSTRQPLAEKPVEVICKNCQNIEVPKKGQDKSWIQDEDAFMKYEGKGKENTKQHCFKNQ